MPSINQRFTARVRDISSEGDGVVQHPDGQIFFVPGVWKEEVAEFRITGFRKRFGLAAVVQVIEPSPDRINPVCSHQGFDTSNCGGCPWQIIAYPAQLEAKEAKIRQALARLDIGDRIKPVWGAPKNLGYRNRAQFKTDGNILGYMARGSKTLAPIEDCPILTDKNRETLNGLLKRLPDPIFKPAQKSAWTTIDIDEDVTAQTIIPNQRRPFRQGNTAQNLRMREWLAQHMNHLDRSLPVLELFSGSGNFTEVISEAGFARILAVEGAGESIAQLKAKNLRGVEGWTCNLFVDGAYRRIHRKMPDAAVLVLDPPRDGARNIRDLLNKKSCFQNVFYISCDLATFTRDLNIFIEYGMKVQEIQPLDQFPHTPHVELLAHLKRK